MKIKQNLKWKILHKTTRNKRSDGCILPTNFHKKVPSKLEIKFKSMYFSFDFDWYCINFNIVSYKQGMRGGGALKESSQIILPLCCMYIGFISQDIHNNYL